MDAGGGSWENRQAVIRHGADIVVTPRANTFMVQPTSTGGETSKLLVVEIFFEELKANVG